MGPVYIKKKYNVVFADVSVHLLKENTYGDG